MLFKNLLDFYNEYEMPLARALFHISQKGIMVDPDELERYTKYLRQEMQDCCEKASIAAKIKVTEGPQKSACNIRSPRDVLMQMKKLGLDIPKVRTAGGWKDDSTSAKTLQRIFAKTGNEFVWQVIRYRELQRMEGTYAKAQLLDNILYCCFRPTGTVTGRRSSTANFLGLGTNCQNLPKHSTVGKMFRRCLVARPGKLFIFCDQKAAEDWIVHALIADASGGLITKGVDELKAGVNRHRKLASFLFGKPESEIGKDSIFYYLAKRVRHAGQYGMRGPRMSDSLAEKGIFIEAKSCEYYLQKFHEAEPEIRGVFQRLIEDQLIQTRTITTPIGRTRVFFGLRSYSDNSAVFRDAYAYLPQSTIADNNGLAILSVFREAPDDVIADQHDAVGTEVNDSLSDCIKGVRRLERAFDRELEFPNGFKVKIPVEFEIGYNLADMKTCDNLTEAGLTNTYASLSRSQNHQDGTTSGVLQPQLQPR